MTESPFDFYIEKVYLWDRAMQGKKQVSKSELLLKIKFKENLSKHTFISVKYITSYNCFLAANH